jgi:hypothetical protein
MEREHLLDLGRRTILDPVVRAGAVAIARYVPVKSLLRMGLSKKKSALASGLPIAGAFVLGAVAGAGVILFLAPGSAELRKTLATRIDAARSRIRHAEEETAEDLRARTAAAKARAAAFASATHGDDGDHKNDHDDHGRPRRRSNPRA